MPNGNDKWSQYEDKPAGDKWAQYEDKSAPTATPPAPENDIGGGFLRRAKQTGKGLYETFKPASGTAEEIASGVGGPGGLALYRTGKGAFDAYRDKSEQLAKDVAAKDYGKAALHGAELLPGSPIGPLSGSGDIADMAAEGRYKEALGAGAFDALTALIGMKPAKGLTPRGRIAKLTSAVGKTGETAENLKTAMPSIEQATRSAGKPTTVGELSNVVQHGIDPHEAAFNQALAGFGSQPIDASVVARDILGLIKSDSSPTEVAALRKAASEYAYVNKQGQVTAPKPQTMQWLNDRRMRLNASSSPLYQKTSGKAATAMRSDLDLAIDRTARDAVADLQYNVMDRAHPGENFAYRKGQVKALWKLKDQLDTRIGQLEDAQMEFEGMDLSEKMRPHVYASGAGVHGYLSGLGEIFSGGPEEAASGKVNKAFWKKPSQTRRAIVLSLPLDRFAASPRQTPFDQTSQPPPELPQ